MEESYGGTGGVQKGIRRQVGDGDNIRVWCDKWVLRPSTYMVVSPENPSLRVSLVKDLTNRDTFEWDVKMVNQCFNAKDASAILGILLNSTGRRDRLIWATNNSGKFSVKSTYALAYEERLEQNRQLLKHLNSQMGLEKYLAAETPTQAKTLRMESRSEYPSHQG